jgi:predicted RND superfamily exporter protein
MAEANKRIVAKMLSSIMTRLLQAVVNHPKVVLLAIFLVLVAAVAGLPRFKLDASAESLTLEHDGALDLFREVSQRYRSGDFLVVTYNPQQDLFSDASLERLAALREDLLAIEGVQSVNSILDVPLLYSPKLSLTEIANGPPTLMSEEVDREKAKQEFLNSPIYKNLILGPEGQTTALQLNLEVDDRYIELVRKRDALREKRASEGLTEEEAAELERISEEFQQYRTQEEQKSRERVQKVRDTVAQYEGHAEIFVGGVSMIAADMVRFIKSDLIVFGVAVIVFMLTILAFIFRSWRFVVIPMAVCLTAVAMMLGLVSWLDWRLTVISSNFVALLLVITLALNIHLVVRYREFLATNPDWSQKQLVVGMARFMARPCLYTSLTTIVAFASLVVSDIGPVIDFGWMMTIGLVVAFILTFTLLPAALVLLPKESTDKAPSKTSRQPLPLYFSAFVEKHGAWVLVSSVIIAALSVWGVTRLQVENRFIDYFHEDTEIHQGLLEIDRKLGGTVSLDILINAPEPATGNSAAFGEEGDPFAETDGFESEDDPFAAEVDPFSEQGDAPSQSYWMTVAGMRQIERLHDWLDAQPEIGKVQSLATLFKVGKDLNGGFNDFELALMSKALPDEVKEVLVDPYLSREHNQTRITMRVIDSYPGLQRRELVERIRNHIAETGNFDESQVQISGLLVLYNNMLESLFSSQIVTLGAVFIGILGMFVILFRSVVVALTAIIPNLLAALAILGSMGLLGVPLDMMTITIAAITLGIGVDGTIHYVHRFKKEIAEDGDYVRAMHRAHGSIGRAVYYTTLVIVFGFSIMVLSEFIPTIYFGLLTGLAMIIALLGSLLLLPKLILLVRPFKVG